MKTVLVTGAAGFIGSHLCKRLLADGCNVIGLDDLSAGALSNIKSILSHNRFKLLIQTVNSEIPTFESIDEIYHLACPASPKAYQSNPVRTILTCVQGTNAMLELSCKYQARLLFSSTSEIYGDALIHPQHEEYFGNVDCIGVRACYDEGKRCAEALITSYVRQYQANACIARIFNTYGPHMQPGDGRVISTFIHQCLNDLPITIFGDGNQTRSFCFVDDTVNGLIKLMNSGEMGPINIGNPEEITMNKLAELIKATTESNSEIVYKPLPSGDPKQRKPDVTKAKTLLDWTPTVFFTEGINKTIEWHKTITVKASV